MKEKCPWNCNIYEALQSHKERAMKSNENFPLLVQRYKDTVFRLAYSYTKNRFDADDVTQDVLLQLYKTDKAFESQAHLKNWLMCVTVNQCKNFFRAPWRKHENLEDYENSIIFDEEESMDLLSTVMEMDQKYRVTLLLYYYEGYTIHEISQIMNTPEKTVSTRLARGRKILKEMLIKEVSL
jgi:RNA polymerase sigma-70 factor (ECF subfamily)